MLFLHACRFRTVNIILAERARLRFPQFVSRFTRAYEGSLRENHLSKADAAAIADLHPSTVSRILGEEIEASPAHVEAMLRAIPVGDRHHCLREFLYDQTPREYWDQLILHFGSIEEPKTVETRDDLSIALARLEEAAENDKDLKKLVIDWANYVGPKSEAEFSAANAAAKARVDKERSAGARKA